MPTSALPHLSERRALQEIGRHFHERGWSVGTSSNYSFRTQRDPLRLLITASGKDKRALADEDFVVVDEAGRPVAAASKPSAETQLHTILARQPEVGAVLHTHSVWSTLLSDWHHATGQLVITGYEMLKGLAGVTTHNYSAILKIYENTQDIPALAQRLRHDLDREEPDLQHGFLLRRHGLYTWGRDLAEARRHVEVLEFLFEVVGRHR